MLRLKLIVIVLVISFGVTSFIPRGTLFFGETVPLVQAELPQQGTTGGCLSPPTVTPSVPKDMATTSQRDANCFAWQEFIALNWLADTTTCQASAQTPASQFGEPNNTAPAVWETYKEASEVFLPNAQKPAGWCSQQAVPLNLTKAKVKNLKKTSDHGFKVLSSIAKDDGNPNLKLSSFQQAGDDSWVTAQNGYVALYEVRLNLDEFNFINQNQLYNANVQQSFATGATGFNLPDGTSQFSQYGQTGSIELKAAWIELDDPSLWASFKTSKAYVVYPSAPNTPKLVTVGLVGLHIIHKTAKGQQFVWATFEHVNNAPSTADINSKTLLPWYTFFNGGCNPSTDHYQCQPNAQIQANYFPRLPQDSYVSPIQVVRTTPISNSTTNNIAGLNQYVWGKISNVNPNSVFLNYQLVNVLWASNSTNIPSGATVPLTKGDPQPNPGTQPVANTTLETYRQAKSCLDCHAFASIAPLNNKLNKKTVNVLQESNKQKVQAGTPIYASDYSFLFSRATSPPVKSKRKGKY